MLNEIDLSSMDLNLLVLFQAVFEERHVARAAQRLHVSPSAVSHGLRRLRDWFDDPLFLRTPKGVVPTTRAGDLAGPIADVLARVKGVVAIARPFEPRTATRRFTIGAPDAVSTVILPPLLAELARLSPGVDLTITHLLQTAVAELETRKVDIAVGPIAHVPARFRAFPFYHEDFVVAARVGHPFLRNPTLEHYCKLRHVVVSMSGDAQGHVDRALEAKGLTRRVALAVPSFTMAISAVAESDLLAALPSHFVASQGERYGVRAAPAPLELRWVPLLVMVPEAATMDAGIAFMLDVLQRIGVSIDGRRREQGARRRSPRKARATRRGR